MQMPAQLQEMYIVTVQVFGKPKNSVNIYNYFDKLWWSILVLLYMSDSAYS